MDNLAKKETITIGPLARCVRHDLTLLVHIKTNYYNSWKYVPTIISDQDSNLIGVRIPQTHDASEGMGATQFDEMALRDSREMNYGSKFLIMSSSLNQGEDEMADGLSNNSLRFPKIWISTIM